MSEGGKSDRQARGAVGVCVCGHVRCVRGAGRRGGEAHLFFKTGRNRCLAICEAPARARVEGGYPSLACHTTGHGRCYTLLIDRGRPWRMAPPVSLYHLAVLESVACVPRACSFVVRAGWSATDHRTALHASGPPIKHDAPTGCRAEQRQHAERPTSIEAVVRFEDSIDTNLPRIVPSSSAGGMR